MKTLFNITTSPDDMRRYADTQDLRTMARGFDGLELMCFEPDQGGLIPPDMVVGLHLGYFPNWLDLWRGDEAALLREFGSREEYIRYYGGGDGQALLDFFRMGLAQARQYEAEYVVFHVSDATVEGSFTRRYHHSDQEVIDGACELLNQLFTDEDGPLLLLENLWQPGLTFTRPDMTGRLLEGINYPNKGLLLDTGHLLHMDLDLASQEQGLAYINRMLDQHGELCAQIRGLHLHQSLTGAYCRRVMEQPPELKPSYGERWLQMLEHAFAVDRHQPFTCPGVDRLIRRVAPAYLTFEFITRSREEHRAFLAAQRQALGLPEI